MSIKKIFCDKLISFPCSAILDLNVFLYVFLFSRNKQCKTTTTKKKIFSVICSGATVAEIWLNPGFTFSLAGISALNLSNGGFFFKLPFKKNQQRWVCCVANSFGKFQSFVLHTFSRHFLSTLVSLFDSPLLTKCYGS